MWTGQSAQLAHLCVHYGLKLATEVFMVRIMNRNVYLQRRCAYWWHWADRCTDCPCRLCAPQHTAVWLPSSKEATSYHVCWYLAQLCPHHCCHVSTGIASIFAVPFLWHWHWGYSQEHSSGMSKATSIALIDWFHDPCYRVAQKSLVTWCLACASSGRWLLHHSV